VDGVTEVLIEHCLPDIFRVVTSSEPAPYRLAGYFEKTLQVPSSHLYTFLLAFSVGDALLLTVNVRISLPTSIANRLTSVISHDCCNFGLQVHRICLILPSRTYHR